MQKQVREALEQCDVKDLERFKFKLRGMDQRKIGLILGVHEGTISRSIDKVRMEINYHIDPEDFEMLEQVGYRHIDDFIPEDLIDQVIEDKKSKQRGVIHA